MKTMGYAHQHGFGVCYTYNSFLIVIFQCRGLSDFAPQDVLGCPNVPWCLGIPGTSHQSQVCNALSLLFIPSYSPMVLWDLMRYPSNPRSGICLVPLVHPIPLSRYLGISWDVPPVPALTLALAQTRGWWDVPWDPKVPWNYGTGWTRGTSMRISTQ